MTGLIYLNHGQAIYSRCRYVKVRLIVKVRLVDLFQLNWVDQLVNPPEMKFGLFKNKIARLEGFTNVQNATIAAMGIGIAARQLSGVVFCKQRFGF